MRSQLFTYNRLFRIFLGATPADPIGVLNDPISNINISINDWRILELIIFAASQKPYESYLQFMEELEVENPENILTDLIAKQVLIDSSNGIEPWDYYSWREAAYYHFTARNAGDVPTSRVALIQSKTTSFPYPSSLLEKIPKSILWDVLKSRRTTRGYKGIELAQENLTAILSLGYGLYLSKFNQDQLQHASEFYGVYVVVHRVNAMQPGVYRIGSYGSTAQLIQLGDFENKTVEIIAGQSMARNTAFSIFITGRFVSWMSIHPYERSYRDFFINLGELAQSFILVATAYNVNSCMTPAIKDSTADELIGVDPLAEQVLYYLGFGI